jgi:hypothetical protein
VPYPHSPYPAIAGYSPSGSGVDGDDDKGSMSDNRVVMFGGKKCDDFVMESIGGLTSKYNFKAPFDRYQPPVVRNSMSDLFRVSSDPLFLPVRRPCVPIIKPPPAPAPTPQAASSGNTPRAGSTKGAVGMPGPSNFTTPQSQPPSASPRAPSLPVQASASSAPSPTLSSSAAAPQSNQRSSSSKSSKATTPSAANSTASASQTAKFVGAASTSGPTTSSNAASSAKTGPASGGSGPSNSTVYMPNMSTNAAPTTAGNAQPHSAKANTFSSSSGTGGQSAPYNNSSVANAGVGVDAGNANSAATAVSSSAAKSSFNAADGSRGVATAAQSSAVATGSVASTSKSTKNNSAAQVVAGQYFVAAAFQTICARFCCITRFQDQSTRCLCISCNRLRNQCLG